MWSYKRNLSAEWNLRREEDLELGRALRALRNAALFLLFTLAVMGAAIYLAWTNEEVPRNRTCADSGTCGGRGSHRF
jgi:hypothetical protein